MAEFWGYVYKEWLLVVRGKWKYVFVSVLILYSGLLFNLLHEYIHVGDIISAIATFIPWPFTLLGIVWAAQIVHRDREPSSGWGSFLKSLPVHPFKIIGSRLVVILFVFLMIIFVPILLWIVLAWAMQAPWDTVMHVIMIMMSTFSPVLFFLLTGMLLGLLIRSKAVYMVAVGAWFLMIYGALYLSLQLPDSWKYIVQSFFLYDEFGYFDGMWGFSYDSMFWLHRGIYLLFAGSLFVLICIQVIHDHQARIRRRRPYGLMALALVTGALAMVGVSIFVQVQDSRVKQYDEAIPVTVGTGTSDHTRLDQYDIQMSYAAEGLLKFHVHATGKVQQGEEITLYLNRMFHVESLNMNGQEMDWHRSGDRIVIPYPRKDILDAAEFQLEIEYNGKVDEWKVVHPYKQATLIIPDHTATKHRLYLPKQLVWLPLPGKAAKSSYRLTIDYPTGIHLYSHLQEVNWSLMESGRQRVEYTGESQGGVTLIGGALKHIDLQSESFRLRIIGSELLRESLIRDYYEPLVQLKSLLITRFPDQMSKREMKIVLSSTRDEFDPGLLDEEGITHRDQHPLSTAGLLPKMHMLYLTAEHDLLHYMHMELPEAQEMALRLALEVLPQTDLANLQLRSLAIISGLDEERVAELLEETVRK